MALPLSAAEEARLRKALRAVRELQERGGLAPSLRDLSLAQRLLPPEGEDAGTEAEGPAAPTDFAVLVQALLKAEADPRLSFVALKLLRDRLLGEIDERFVGRPDLGQQAISSALERGAVLAARVPNPKSPAFPTTALRLNRAHPDVMRMLATDEDDDFEPVDLRGEPLSRTVIEGRR